MFNEIVQCCQKTELDKGEITVAENLSTGLGTCPILRTTTCTIYTVGGFPILYTMNRSVSLPFHFDQAPSLSKHFLQITVTVLQTSSEVEKNSLSISYLWNLPLESS